MFNQSLNLKKIALFITIGLLWVIFLGYLTHPVSANKVSNAHSKEIAVAFDDFEGELTDEGFLNLSKALEDSYETVEEQVLLGNYIYAEWELRRIISLLVDPSFPQLGPDVEVETWSQKDNPSVNTRRIDSRTRNTPLICRFVGLFCNSSGGQTRPPQNQDFEEEVAEVTSEIERIVVDPSLGVLGDEDSRAKLEIASERFYTLALKSLNLLQEILAENYFADNDEGSKNEALVVAELKRQYENIRLSSLLRLENQDSDTSIIKRLDIDSVKDISNEQQSIIVYYSSTNSGNLHIWVINSQGSIDFEKESLGSESNIILERAESARKVAASYVERGDAGIGYEVWKRGLRTRFADDDEVEQSIVDQDEQNSALSSLYELLIAPIENYLPKDDPEANVVFVPQGPLFNVPFSVLKDRNEHYVIERYTIRIAPSLRVLKVSDFVMEELPQGGETLFVGNPIMPVMNLNENEDSQELRDLAGAQAEARALARLFEVFPLVRNLASETFIRSKMRTAKLIHLATHGILDDADLDIDLAEIIEEENRSERPPQSDDSNSVRSLLRGAVALAPSPENDGFLTATEILGMSLDAELVVMSACNTGRGIPSESTILGLPYAFGAAGASRAIVSLWSVPDEPTQLLMELFYKEMKNQALANGEVEPAKALRYAMLEIEQQEQYKDPVNWAGFTLIEVSQDN